MSKIICLILMLMPVLAFTQNYSVYYDWTKDDLSKKKLERKFKYLNRNGYRLGELNSKTVLVVSDFRNLMKAMSKRKDKVLISVNGDQVEVSKNELMLMARTQLWDSTKLSSKKKIKIFEKYLRRLSKAKKRWIAKHDFLLGFDNSKNYNDTVNFEFISGRKHYATLTFRPLEYNFANNFPVLDTTNCTPFNRVTYFLNKNYRSTQIPYNLPFYMPRSTNRYRETFDLHFEKNSIRYDQQDFNEIVQYLKSTPLSISKAVIKGFASVEGDSLNNSKLHEARAAALVKTLEVYNKKKIRYHVESEENWSKFYTQIKKNGLDSLSKEEWRTVLKKDSVNNALEYLLSEQRRSVITLYMYDKKNADELWQEINLDVLNILDDVNVSLGFYGMRSAIPKLKLMLSMRDYILERIEAEDFTFEMLKEFDNKIYMYPQYHIMTFYHDMELIDQPYMSKKYLENKGQRAFTEAMIKFIENRGNKLIQADLSKIQTMIYDQVQNKKFSPDAITSLQIPDHPYLYQLRLQQFHLIEDLAEKNILKIEKAESMSATSPYYWLLKKVVMGEVTGELKSQVLRSDWIVEFDTYQFLVYNVNNWDPLRRIFFDSAVDEQTMNKVLKYLFSIRKTLCPDNLDELALNFYKKVLQVAATEDCNFELVEDAYSFIDEYYTNRQYKIADEQKVAVCKQVQSVNHYFYYNEPKRFADRLLAK